MAQCGMGNYPEFGNFLTNSGADMFQTATPRFNLSMLHD